MQSVHIKNSWLLTFFLLTIVAIALFAFQPQEMIRDSAYWARLVETRDPNIWHPHHLIYMPINLAILDLLAFFCSDCNAIDAGQIHSAVWAFVTVLCMQAIVFRFTGKPFIAFSFALLIATSQMPWVFAMQPQAYTPLIGSLSLLLAYLFRTKSDPYSLGWALFTAALYGLTVLYHQAMVLISLPLAYYVFRVKRSHRFEGPAVVLFVSGTVVLLLYVWAAGYVKGELSPRSFYEYLTFFGQVMADPTYFNLDNFTIHNFVTLLNSQLSVIQAPIWKFKEPILWIFTVILGGGVIWNVRQVIVRADFSDERLFLVLLIIIFWGLTIWGNPVGDGWPTFILLPIFLVLSIIIYDLSGVFGKIKYANGSVAFVLFLLVFAGAARNFNERILPMHLDRGEDYRQAELIAAVVPKDCTIYESRMLVYYNLDYFFSRTIRDFWDMITASYYGSGRQREMYFGVPDESQCIALDVRYLHPLYRVSGKTAFDFPEEWAALVGWIFDIEETSPGLFQWRQMRAARTSSGQSYVIISRGRGGEPLPIDHFWRALVSASASGEKDTVDAHADWLRHACEGKKLQSYFGSLCG